MKNDAYLFAIEVDRQIEELSSADFLKHDKRGKLLQEEILPISRLALHLKQPGLKIEVEAFETDGKADGHIQIKGFREDDFDVQVTCTFTYKESLRRELLVSEGYAPGAGDICRDKKSGQMVANFTATNFDEHITRVSQSVIRRFQKKAVKTYAENTVLIIAFDDVKLYGHHNWCQLFELLRKAGSLSESRFKAIYLFNSATNEIQRAA